MTKARTPLSFADAIERIGGRIGWDVAAAIVNRSQRTVRLWSEPDAGGMPTLAQALVLDAAYSAAGGHGAPLLEAYQHMLSIAVDAAKPCHEGLAADASDAARECGDAIAAAIVVTRPGASPAEVRRAIAETRQGVGTLVALARRLTSFLPAGAGPAAGNDGGVR